MEEKEAGLCGYLPFILGSPSSEREVPLPALHLRSRSQKYKAFAALIPTGLFRWLSNSVRASEEALVPVRLFCPGEANCRKRNQSRGLAAVGGEEVNLGAALRNAAWLPASRALRKAPHAPNAAAFHLLAGPRSVNGCRQLGHPPRNSVADLFSFTSTS